MNDLRAAIRRLTASRRFTALALTILAVGVAGNAVVFSLVNGLFIRPLPFPYPEPLLDVDATAPKWKIRYTGINYDDFAAWREPSETFSGMATFHRRVRRGCQMMETNHSVQP